MRLAAAGLAVTTLWAASGAAAFEPIEWHHTEGDAGGGRYSPLAEINRHNVGDLRPVWEYHHGDIKTGSYRPDQVNRGTAFEATPIVVGGRLYFSTPFNRVVALDARTGRELWTFDPGIDRDAFFANMIISRGVAHWRGPANGGPCAERVFLATLAAELIALDATSGRPCADFGASGRIDLVAGLERMPDRREYNVTSPPAIVGDTVIVGSSIADAIRRRSPPGDVRAFDVRTGALRWTFHTIPKAGQFGHDTWQDGSASKSGAANVWTTMTVDVDRGRVFLPVSSASPDFFGGDRPGANLFSDSLVALDARTGHRVWHFQTVHHDLWDYDLASPANLVRIRRGDRMIDAVALPTKQGFVFVLDRDTGVPVFPVEERPVPASDIPEEHAWPTQPIPTRPPALVPQRFSADDLYAPDPAHLEACRRALAPLRNDGLFTPPSVTGSVLYPFTGGGANWSGSAYDPTRNLLIVPVNNRVHVIRLRRLPDDNVDDEDAQPLRSYLHGLWFLLTGRGTGERYGLHPLTGRTTLAVDGVPCNRPPWGLLVAVDLGDGSIRWRMPTGHDGEVDGLPNYGPALVTGGGLVFHAGTSELTLRAHDVDTGEVLARFPLPAGLHAGPITYKLGVDERQFLVIAPGGHVGLGSKLGDAVIAYALPDRPADAASSAATDR